MFLDFDAELFLAPLDHGILVIHILATGLEILGAGSLLPHTKNNVVGQAKQISHGLGIQKGSEGRGFGGHVGISKWGRWEQEIVPTIV